MMGDFSNKHKQVMRLLLFFDTLRGEDSTGLSAIRFNGDVETFKMTVPGTEFLKYQKLDDMMRLSDKLWMGHNRHKTTGAISRVNAHPFEVLNDRGEVELIGAHNGTLQNKWDIPNDKAYGTDSEALFNFMAEAGVKEAISKVRGAWSLTWFDCYEDTLNFLRNDDRPMCFALSEDGKSIIWASEEWMIRVACARVDLKIQEIHYPKPNVWIVFDLPKNREKIGESRFEGGVEGAPPPKTFQSSTTSSGNSYGYTGGWPIHRTNHSWKEEQTTTEKRSTESAKPKEEGTKTDKVSAPFVPLNKSKDDLPLALRGFDGKVITKAKLEMLATHQGCEWCGGELDTKKKWAWLEEEVLVCGKCIDDSHFVEEEEDDNVIRLPSALNPVQKEALQRHAEGLKVKGKK